MRCPPFKQTHLQSKLQDSSGQRKRSLMPQTSADDTGLPRLNYNLAPSLQTASQRRGDPGHTATLPPWGTVPVKMLSWPENCPSQNGKLKDVFLKKIGTGIIIIPIDEVWSSSQWFLEMWLENDGPIDCIQPHRNAPDPGFTTMRPRQALPT